MPFTRRTSLRLGRLGDHSTRNRLAYALNALDHRRTPREKQPWPKFREASRLFAWACRACYRRAMIKTGLLGGSFNPAHRGHRQLSINAIEALGMDQVWWMVSPGNPLKPSKDMAPFEARFASARAAARGQPIRVTGIERDLGTRYTVDTLRALLGRYPRRRFIWLMGADNLAQLHLWKDWREIAALVPIAVVARPGYEGAAHAARAMGWLRRYVRPAAEARHWTQWSLPALVLLRLPPDPTSATGIRAADPDWHQKPISSFNPKRLRDQVTRRPIS